MWNHYLFVTYEKKEIKKLLLSHIHEKNNNEITTFVKFMKNNNEITAFVYS